MLLWQKGPGPKVSWSRGCYSQKRLSWRRVRIHRWCVLTELAPLYQCAAETMEISALQRKSSWGISVEWNAKCHKVYLIKLITTTLKNYMNSSTEKRNKISWTVKSPFNNCQHLNPSIKQVYWNVCIKLRNSREEVFSLSSLVTVWFCACEMLAGLFCSRVMLSANHDLLILSSSITKHYSRCKPPIYSTGISLHMDTKGLQKSFPHKVSTILASKRICFDQSHLHKDCTTSVLPQNQHLFTELPSKFLSFFFF